jgi:hypothetical protein
MGRGGRGGTWFGEWARSRVDRASGGGGSGSGRVHELIAPVAEVARGEARSRADRASGGRDSGSEPVQRRARPVGGLAWERDLA